MTNEERIEERLIHAHERGYYHKVMEKVRYKRVGRRSKWDGMKILGINKFCYKEPSRANVLRLKMYMKFKTRIIINY